MKTTVDILNKTNIAALITAIIILMILPSVSASEDDRAVQLDEIVVIATRNPGPSQEIPSSVRAFDSDAMESAGVALIGDAAAYVPNVNMVEFTERVLSQPYFRGIGSGPNNPAVTTYIDGVPQLHGYSANVELLDVKQVEFARGAQGMLYGRNTVGGVIHILSRSPGFDSLEFSMEAEYGDYDLTGANFRLSGPVIKDEMGFSLTAGYTSRDGFSNNDITGNDIDSREAFFSKLQLKWFPNDQWSARFILFAEQDRDGDYALHDLAALRANPYHVQRDFEGHLDRDIFAPTLAIEYNGDRADFVSLSGLVKLKTDGITDLDYTPFAATTREQRIRNLQFTQEFQWSSLNKSPILLNDNIKLAWQAGIFLFMQDYSEASINNIAPLRQTSYAELEDTGIGVYAQAILTTHEVWDLSLGLRMDHEEKDAELRSVVTPAIPGLAPPPLNTGRDFTEVSPRFSLTRKIAPGKISYASINRGYRAGGFNPFSPPGFEAFNEETTWNYEAGIKTTWIEGRFKFNMAVFHIEWNHLQLNLPIGQSYYISNAGDAESTGVELELFAMPSPNWDIFGSFGYNSTSFGDGSSSIQTDAFGTNSTINIGGNDLIFTPDFTASAGTQYSWELGPGSRLFMRVEITGHGRYFYNTANTQSQESYWLTSLRAGYKTSTWFIEAWAKNLFDKEYIPVAFEFPNFQSGFLGENGAPLTVGLRAGFTF